MQKPGLAVPDLERPVTLRFQGDWGQANLTRVCNWIGQEFIDRAPPGSRTVVWDGRGGSDAIDALRKDDVDIAMMTPARFANMAIDGRGGFEVFDNLCALGVIGQDDRLLVGIAADLGFATVDDIIRAEPALTVVTSPDDGVNLVGFAAQRLLEAIGLPRSRIEEWGGRFIEHERPFDCIPEYHHGVADMIIHEAIMIPMWVDAVTERPINFLPIDDAALSALEHDLGLARNTLAAGYYPGLTADVPTLDFSDFAMLTTTSLPDDVARLVAWCLTHTGYQIDRQYAHLPPDRTPLTYPVTPQKVASSPVPLHPAARDLYAELGVLP